MRLILPILLAPALLSAQQPDEPKSDIPTELPAVSLMPVGSKLEKVMIPRYDNHRKLTSVLRADKLTVVDPQSVSGEKVSVEICNPDRTPKANIHLQDAVFDQKKGTLESRTPVEIVSPDFTGKGTGLSYAYEQRRGFLLGPVQTQFLNHSQKTSMNSPLIPKRAATTAIATAMLSMPVMAERPPRLTQEEQDALTSRSASIEPELKKKAAETNEIIEEKAKISSGANETVAAFLKQAALTTISLEADSGKSPEAKPLEVQQTPQDTVIDSDDGMYFDAEKGLLVYLKNVRLHDPRFTLTGANELKILLEKKPEPKTPANNATEKEKTDATLDNAGATFGSVDTIIATGAVKLVQKPAPGKETVEASAALVTYNAKTGEIILKGGYPWVKQGDKVFRAMQPDLYVRIQKDFSFTTGGGNWQTSGRLDNTSSGAKPSSGAPKNPKTQTQSR